MTLPIRARAESELPQRIGRIQRVVIRKYIWLIGLCERRVDGDELFGGRIVVAVD